MMDFSTLQFEYAASIKMELMISTFLHEFGLKLIWYGLNILWLLSLLKDATLDSTGS